MREVVYKVSIIFHLSQYPHPHPHPQPSQHILSGQRPPSDSIAAPNMAINKLTLLAFLGPALVRAQGELYLCDTTLQPDYANCR
jgi:hypothetical protein